SVNGSVTLSVMANGTGSLTYQWYKGGTLLLNQTNDTLVLNSVVREDGARYTVAVSDDFGTRVSSQAVVSVIEPLPILWRSDQHAGFATSPALGEGGVIYVAGNGPNGGDLYSYGPRGGY